MNRRTFWKFLAATPVAAVAPLVGAKAKPEIPADAIHIKGASVTITNLRMENSGGIVIEKDSEAAIHGAYITNVHDGVTFK